MDPRILALQQMRQTRPPQTTIPEQPTQLGSGEIFSGGPIWDVIDALSIPLYATAGAAHAAVAGDPLLEGVKRGVQQRVDWTDVLRETMPDSSPLTTSILGTVGNIALDPSWLIAPVKVVGLAGRTARAVAPGTVRAVQQAGRAVAATPTAQRALSWADRGLARHAGIGLRPETRAVFRAIDKAKDLAQREAAPFIEAGQDLVKRVQQLSPEAQQQVSRYIEAGLHGGVAGPRRLRPEELDRLRQGVLADAQRMGLDADAIKQLGDEWIALDRNLGRHLVDAGVITEAQFKAYEGQHIRRIYQRYEDTEKWIEELRKVDPQQAMEVEARLRSGRFAFEPGPTRPVGQAGATREALSPEARQFLGEITDTAPRMARSLHVGVIGLRRGRMLKELSSEFSSSTVRPGYVQVPNSRSWGDLAGSYVPAPLWNEIQLWERTPGALERIFKRFNSNWKFAKVVANPAAQARNVMSNFLLADFGGTPSPFVRPDLWAQAWRDISRNTPLAQEARRTSSTFLNTFVEAEFRQMGDELVKAAQQGGKGFMPALGKVLQKVTGPMAKSYDFAEKWGKMAMYRYGRTQLGMNPQQAAKYAEEWLFNYGKVPRLIENLSSWGVAPFIRWPYFAVPATAKALYNNPGRVLKWFRVGTGVERARGDEAQTAAESRVLPEWMQRGAWIRLPITDEHNRSVYLDLTYILPFGDIGEIAGVGTAGSSLPGLRGDVANAVSHVLNTPYLTFIQDLMRNNSAFTGRPIWEEGDTPKQQYKKAVEYMAQFLLPSLAPGGYSYSNLKAAIMKTPDWMGRTRTLNQAIASSFFGLKTRPVAYNEELMFRIREIQDKINAVERNMRMTALHANQGRVSKDYAEDVWDEGIRMIELLFRQYAALTS